MTHRLARRKKDKAAAVDKVTFYDDLILKYTRNASYFCQY